MCGHAIFCLELHPNGDKSDLNAYISAVILKKKGEKVPSFRKISTFAEVYLNFM